MLNLPPSQATQARQQLDRRFFFLVLQNHLAMVKTESQPPFTVVSNAIVEEEYEIICGDVHNKGGIVEGSEVVILLEVSGATTLRYHCQYWVAKADQVAGKKTQRFQLQIRTPLNFPRRTRNA